MGENLEKQDVHITLYEYQYEYLREQNYNLSAVLRDPVDGRIIEDGAEPERLRDSKGE